jgi:hypothetical protein
VFPAAHGAVAPMHDLQYAAGHALQHNTLIQQQFFLILK